MVMKSIIVFSGVNNILNSVKGLYFKVLFIIKNYSFEELRLPDNS